MSGDEMEWGDPPPMLRGTVGATPIRTFVERLQLRPGEWAKYPGAVTRQMGTQNARLYPGTQWTTRIRDDRKCDLWGRWIGGDD